MVRCVAVCLHTPAQHIRWKCPTTTAILIKGPASLWYPLSVLIKKSTLTPFPEFSNEYKCPHPWDTHYRFSIKTLLSNVKKRCLFGGCLIEIHVHYKDMTWPTSTLRTPCKRHPKRTANTQIHTLPHPETTLWTHCNTLQRTATNTTHCNTLQHTATHSNTLWRAATHCNTLQHTATYCNILQHMQHTATHCKALQHTAMHCNIPQHTATHCNSPQRTATHCNMDCSLSCVLAFRL